MGSQEEKRRRHQPGPARPSDQGAIRNTGHFPSDEAAPWAWARHRAGRLGTMESRKMAHNHFQSAKSARGTRRVGREWGHAGKIEILKSNSINMLTSFFDRLPRTP